MPPPVRVAVLGNGFAARVQLPALARLGGHQVVGLAGRDGARARATAERFGIPCGSDSWEEVLALEPDLVLVTTPVDLHAPMVRGALGVGAAVVCEKPFALDAAEAADLVEAAGDRVEIIRDPAEAAKGSALLVTDVWASMGQEEEKAERRRKLAGYQINAELMSHANPDALYMHCLPAKRGEEISAELMDSPDTVIWDEAENRLHAQKALMEFLLTQ